MSANEQHKPGHYSGLNRIPNIKEFAAALDRDKKDRDAKIDAEAKAQKKGSIKDHRNEPAGKKGKGRTVTDPVTGKEVEIEDVNTDFMKAVEDPQARFSNKMSV